MLPCLKLRANTPREHFFICLLASRRTRTHSILFAIMRQHLHNSVLSSRAPEAKQHTKIPTQDPFNGHEVDKGVFVLGNATLEVVAPLPMWRFLVFCLFIYLFIYLFEIARFVGLG